MAGTLIQKLKALAHHGIGGDKLTRTDYVKNKVLFVRLTPIEMYVNTKHLLSFCTGAYTGHRTRQPPAGPQE
jgi:hypothetical protein